MGNIATTIDEQIKILKERGLIIKDEKKAEEQLLDIGYYRLGFYWFHFQDKNHRFQQGVCFDDIIDLYYLDSDLKHFLMKIISRIEINFRTKLVYQASNEYKQSPTWFADPKILHSSFIDSLPVYYSENFKKVNKTIKKHHDKYINDKYAPAWKTLEFFTFGSILKIYKSLKNNDLKNRIASEYEIKSPKLFINFLEVVLFIRNISAHGGTLYDCNTPKEIKSTSLVPFDSDKKHSLDTAIKVILFILNKISENRYQEAKQELEKIINKHMGNNNIKKIITNCIKYPL